MTVGACSPAGRVSASEVMMMPRILNDDDDAPVEMDPVVVHGGAELGGIHSDFGSGGSVDPGAGSGGDIRSDGGNDGDDPPPRPRNRVVILRDPNDPTRVYRIVLPDGTPLDVTLVSVEIIGKEARLVFKGLRDWVFTMIGAIIPNEKAGTIVSNTLSDLTEIMLGPEPIRATDSAGNTYVIQTNGMQVTTTPNGEQYYFSSWEREIAPVEVPPVVVTAPQAPPSVPAPSTPQQPAPDRGTMQPSTGPGSSPSAPPEAPAAPPQQAEPQPAPEPAPQPAPEPAPSTPEPQPQEPVRFPPRYEQDPRRGADDDWVPRRPGQREP